MEVYCVKCRTKKEVKDGEEITVNGKGGCKRRAFAGKCPDCGTKVVRFLPKAKKK